MEECLRIVREMTERERSIGQDQVCRACSWLKGNEACIGERLCSAFVPSANAPQLAETWDGVLVHIRDPCTTVHEMLLCVGRVLLGLGVDEDGGVFVRRSLGSLECILGMARSLARPQSNTPLQVLMVIHGFENHDHGLLGNLFKSMTEFYCRHEETIRFSVAMLYSKELQYEARLADHLYVTQFPMPSPHSAIQCLIHETFVEQALPLFWGSELFQWVVDMFSDVSFSVDLFETVMSAAVVLHFTSHVTRGRVPVCSVDAFLDCWMVDREVNFGAGLDVLAAFKGYSMAVENGRKYASDLASRARDAFLAHGSVAEERYASIVKVLEERKLGDERSAERIDAALMAMMKSTEPTTQDEAAVLSTSGRGAVIASLLSRTMTAEDRRFGRGVASEPPQKRRTVAYSQTIARIDSVSKCYASLLGHDGPRDLSIFCGSVPALQHGLVGQVGECADHLRRMIQCGDSKSREDLCAVFGYCDQSESSQINLRRWRRRSKLPPQQLQPTRPIWKTFFPRWMTFWDHGFSLLIGGVGDKRQVFEEFWRFARKTPNQTEAPIYVCGHTTRSAGALPGQQLAEKCGVAHEEGWGKNQTTLSERWQAVRSYFVERGLERQRFCVYVDSIDGPETSTPQALALFSDMAGFVRLVATVDNKDVLTFVCATQVLIAFRWWHVTAHTFAPFRHSSLEVRERLHRELNVSQAIKQTLKKYPPQAMKCYSALCGRVIEAGLKRGRQPGVFLSDWRALEGCGGVIKDKWVSDWLEKNVLETNKDGAYIVPMEMSDVEEIYDWINEQPTTETTETGGPTDGRFLSAVLGLERMGIVTLIQTSAGGIVVRKKNFK